MGRERERERAFDWSFQKFLLFFFYFLCTDTCTSQLQIFFNSIKPKKTLLKRKDKIYSSRHDPLSNKLSIWFPSKFIYLGESKVWQYFCNMKHNLAALDAFTEIVKVTNHNGLWDAKLAWYSLLNLPLWPWYPVLVLTWLCLIIEVLTIKAKFLRLSGYCTVINKHFGYFHGIMAQFQTHKA